MAAVFEYNRISPQYQESIRLWMQNTMSLHSKKDILPGSSIRLKDRHPTHIYRQDYKLNVLESFHATYHSKQEQHNLHPTARYKSIRPHYLCSIRFLTEQHRHTRQGLCCKKMSAKQHSSLLPELLNHAKRLCRLLTLSLLLSRIIDLTAR